MRSVVLMLFGYTKGGSYRDCHLSVEKGLLYKNRIWKQL